MRKQAQAYFGAFAVSDCPQDNANPSCCTTAGEFCDALSENFA